MLSGIFGRRSHHVAVLLGLAASALAQAPASVAPAEGAAPLSGPQVIQMLDRTIAWYRTLAIQQQAANQPSDVFILYDNRQTANRVIALAFEIARADTELLARSGEGSASGTRDAVTQPIVELKSRFARQLSGVQTELQETQRQLSQATGTAATDLQAKVSELQGEIDLFTARQSLVTTMLSIASESDASSFSPDALRAQVDAMAVTLGSSNSALATPAADAGAPPANSATPLEPLIGTSVNVAARYGIWDLAANVFKLSEKLATIDSLDSRTLELTDLFKRIRLPVTERLKSMSQQGDALASAADHASTADLKQTRQALDALSEQFKTASRLMVPLGKVGVSLTQYHHNLDNWRHLVASQYRDALRTLGLRVLVLLAMLAVVFIAARIWQRAVLRYAHEPRRRAQLLLVQRIVIGALVVLVVGFAFASELTALFTFAGLIAAGLAVAMQSVLVSFVGYFFLIGKYGIRLGDRVQVGEVVGEVIELGLVRLHLMELGAKGLSGPTGRVVAFPNSIVFQVSTGLFKQISGVDLAWHELALSLPADVDYGATKERLVAAVEVALKDSREEILRQAREIQRTTASNSGEDASPRVQLVFSAAGVEAKVRYPVHMSNAAEIDERVSQEVLATLRQLEHEKRA